MSWQFRPLRTVRILAVARRWLLTVGPWWAASVAGHLALLVVVGLIAGTVHVVTRTEAARTFEFDNVVKDVPPDELPIQPILPDKPPIEPTRLTIETLLDRGRIGDEQPTENKIDSREIGVVGADPPGGLSDLVGGQPFDAKEIVMITPGNGPGGRSTNETGTGSGGGGGNGNDLQQRGDRKLNRGGMTPASERAVAAALNWFARHQEPGGGWSLGQYNRQCKDATCTGAGNAQSDAAATAFALLPFLAAGHTHQTDGVYRRAVYGGLFWLVNHQEPSGSLAAGQRHLMYTHGLCTIALCEAYGMTQDKQLGAAAQQALHFIETAQNQEDGGWRYTPGQPGDTSVVGWQLMALKSGQMAGLSVDDAVLARAKKYLQAAAAKSRQGGLFGYQPETSPTPAMTGVGLLCSQYSGMKRDDTGMVEGVQFLMRNQPNPQQRNSYYWYYATQVMHNLPGPDWDTWNRKMRRTLIESQVKDGCAAGSWDPLRPVRDSSHAESGGRIMTTSLATLTLEVYYRYLPLYQLDKQDEARAK